MAYNRVNWQNGEKTADAYVEIDGQRYPVTDAEYSGETPINDRFLNIMDRGIKDNSVDVLTSSSSSGRIQIGTVGIEWGIVSITTSNTPSTTNPFSVYLGSTNVSFVNNYEYNPMVITNWAGSYYNQMDSFSSSVTNTGCTIGGHATTANSTRNIRYLVIGTIFPNN